MKIKLGVIFGGESVEHEVSIISALQAIQNLDKNKYEVVPIYIAKDRTWYTGHMLEDIESYKDFDNTKKFAKKVVLYKKGNKFLLQGTTGLFRKDITDIDIILPVVHGICGNAIVSSAIVCLIISVSYALSANMYVGL